MSIRINLRYDGDDKFTACAIGGYKGRLVIEKTRQNPYSALGAVMIVFLMSGYEGGFSHEPDDVINAWWWNILNGTPEPSLTPRSQPGQ